MNAHKESYRIDIDIKLKKVRREEKRKNCWNCLSTSWNALLGYTRLIHIESLSKFVGIFFDWGALLVI